MFNAAVEASRVVNWTREYFNENGGDSSLAVVGISGGIDSTTVAAICAAAIGPKRVLGVQLPEGMQDDFDDATNVIHFLDIPKVVYDIGPVSESMYLQMSKLTRWGGINDIIKNNNPARIRMMVLYMLANQIRGRVANTCNLSETYVGYDTKWGDNVGDFAPIAKFTKTEVKQIAYALGIPEKMINKPSHDGMCGLNDEERWGFTYKQLDAYIRDDFGLIDAATALKINSMHMAALHKIESVNLPTYPYCEYAIGIEEFGRKMLANSIIYLLGDLSE